MHLFLRIASSTTRPSRTLFDKLAAINILALCDRRLRRPLAGCTRAAAGRLPTSCVHGALRSFAFRVARLSGFSEQLCWVSLVLRWLGSFLAGFVQRPCGASADSGAAAVQRFSGWRPHGARSLFSVVLPFACIRVCVSLGSVSLAYFWLVSQRR